MSSLERHELKHAHRGTPILPLPEDVVAQIKSSTAIVSLTGAVLELLKNALDAGASKVDATVDFARGGCSVEDNGLGIAPSEFRDEGGLGKLYCTSVGCPTTCIPILTASATSKYYSEDACLGRNGTFLASLGAMSLLTIVSRHHQYRSHNLLALHHAKVIDRQLPATAQHDIHGEHGTRVTVRNLFGNLPVRVKQRGIAAEQKTQSDRLWETLRREVTSLMLSWSKPITVRVRGVDGKTSVSFSTTAQGGHEPRTRSSGFNNMLNVLTQAKYISHDSWGSWVPVSASTSTVSIKGAISLDPAPSKRIQFISLGISPLTSDGVHNELFDEINRIFSTSSFGNVEDDADADEKENFRRQHDKRFKNDGYTNRQLKSRKGVDRYPMFHLRLSPNQEVMEAGKDAAENLFGSVAAVLNAMVTEWLITHHFRPSNPRTHRQPPTIDTTNSSTSDTTLSGEHASRLSHMSGSRAASTPPTLGPAASNSRKRKRSKALPPEKGADSRYQLPFSDWSRIKSSNASFLEGLGRKRVGRPWTDGALRNSPDLAVSSTIATPHFTKLDVPPVPEGTFNHGGCSGETIVEETPIDEGDYDKAISWTDPTTRKTHLLNARTGCVLHRPPGKSLVEKQSIGSKDSFGIFNKSVRLPSQASLRSNDSDTWLAGILKKWDNPVFKPTERSIPQSSLCENQDRAECNHHHGSGMEQKQDSMGSFSTARMSKLSRAGLEQAEVMAQLDRKFILVKMKKSQPLTGSGNESNLLVLIDQHAADERIRVEDLLSGLCSAVSNDIGSYRSNLGHCSPVPFTILDKAIQFTVSAQEQDQFTAHAARFAAWGILFDITTPVGLSNRPQPVVLVTALPPVITERCKADPQVLITFLRTAVWKYAEDSSLPLVPESLEVKNDNTAWVQRIASCPEGLIDLVNSRACRSAIMFNDELSLRECRELVRRLCT